jgi:hypothetical protein
MRVQANHGIERCRISIDRELLERDAFRWNRYRALALRLSMVPRVKPEGMLFRIML